MLRRLSIKSSLGWWVLSGLVVGFAVPTIAQDRLELSDPTQSVPPPPAPGATEPGNADALSNSLPGDDLNSDLPEGAEVMVTGPLHEAFAEQFSDEPEPGIVIAKQPPEPIDEVPPEYRPEGQDIVWIPGYWGWDPEREDFLWITGIWRQAPPDRNWVPGYWAQVPEGYQWIAGFWSLNSTAEIRYLPAPPEPLMAEPSTPAPSQDHFWIPGQWSYVNNDYQWRAGYWTMGYPDWVWVADRYVWTPMGCIYRAGYWDYVVPERGTVFCPVYWSRPVANYRFRPTYVVGTGPTLLANLFVYPRYHHYFFGNYYSSRYLGQTIYPWVTYSQQSRRYDPLAGYYRAQGRDNDTMNRLVRLHNYYAANVNYQPPRTLTAQREHHREHHRDLDNRQDLMFHAAQLNKMAGAAGQLQDHMQLVKLADNERRQIERGLDPAIQFRKQRAEAEGRGRVNGDPRTANNGSGKPGDNKAGDNKPGDNKPGDNKPGDNKPGDNKLGDNRPGGNKPGDNKRDDFPGGKKGLGDIRWNLPQLQNGERLGSISVGQPNPAARDSEPSNRDVGNNRGKADTNGRVGQDGSKPNSAAPRESNNRVFRPGDINQDGVVDSRDTRKPDARDRDNRDAQKRDAVNRDALNRDAGQDPLKRNPLSREPGNPDPLNRAQGDREPKNPNPNKPNPLNPNPLNPKPLNPNPLNPSPANPPNANPLNRIPSAQDPLNRSPINRDPGGRADRVPPNNNREPVNRNPLNRDLNIQNPLQNRDTNPGKPAAGAPQMPRVNPPNTPPAVDRKPAVDNRPRNVPDVRIQNDLKQMRESAQRQTQRRNEAGNAPRRAPQAPGKDK